MSLTDIMSNAGLAGYAVAAMVLFIMAFLVVVVRIWWPGRRREMDAASRLPLDDQHIQTPRDGAKP